MKESKPVWLVTLSINHPFKFVSIGFLLLLISAGLAIGLGYFEYDDISYRDTLIWDHPSVINWDKQVIAREHI